jgi:phospholipid/cholesterol/gamma-HCH transport system substrate-binding protein
MGRNVIETILGAVVLLVAGFFIVFAYNSSDLNKTIGYTVTANFPNVDGLKVGSDVKVNGLRVGSVTEQKIITDSGPNQFLIQVRLAIDPSVKLPNDTIAMIANESLLGGKYMSLEIGVEEDSIKTDGTGKISRTQAPMRLDDLIGRLIFNSDKSKEEKKSDIQMTPGVETQNMASSHP